MLTNRSVGVVTILPDGSLMLSKLLQGHVSRVRALDCHGDRVLSGSDDRTVKLWSLNSGKFHKKICKKVQFDETNYSLLQRLKSRFFEFFSNGATRMGQRSDNFFFPKMLILVF